MKKLLFLLLALPTAAFASGAALHLDRAPVNPNDQESLQRGARVFVIQAPEGGAGLTVGVGEPGGPVRRGSTGRGYLLRRTIRAGSAVA